VNEPLTVADLEAIEQLEAADARGRERQSKRLVVNIDEAWAERSAQAFEFVFQGKPYQVPAQMPARVFLFMWRHLFTPIGGGKFRFDIPDEVFVETVKQILGEELARELLESELAIGWVTSQLLLPVLQAWGVPLGQEEESTTQVEKKTALTRESSSGPGPS